MPRYIHGLLLSIVIGLGIVFAAGIALTAAGCGKTAGSRPVAVVDLMRELGRAEKRPAAAFLVEDRRVGGVSRPSIVAPVPSRMTWPLPVPRRGVFHAFVSIAEAPPGTVAGAVRLRVGISDHRIYEGLSEVMINPGTQQWIDLRADLSAYAGWKWSLFYQPERVTWRLVLAADATVAAPATAMWGSPEILTDSRSAREYATRRMRR
jgi:hypothetical protein